MPRLDRRRRSAYPLLVTRRQHSGKMEWPARPIENEVRLRGRAKRGEIGEMWMTTIWAALSDTDGFHRQ